MPSSCLSSRLLPVGLLVLALAGCSSTPTKAPVEDRKPAKPVASPAAGSKAAAATPPPAIVEAPKPLPGAENAGRAGYYTVKPGDTLYSIAKSTGVDAAKLMQLNQGGRLRAVDEQRALHPF